MSAVMHQQVKIYSCQPTSLGSLQSAINLRMSRRRPQLLLILCTCLNILHNEEYRGDLLYIHFLTGITLTQGSVLLVRVAVQVVYLTICSQCTEVVLGWMQTKRTLYEGLMNSVGTCLSYPASTYQPPTAAQATHIDSTQYEASWFSGCPPVTVWATASFIIPGAAGNSTPHAPPPSEDKLHE